jgi:hypothetical protein
LEHPSIDTIRGSETTYENFIQKQYNRSRIKGGRYNETKKSGNIVHPGAGLGGFHRCLFFQTFFESSISAATAIKGIGGKNRLRLH